ncbi:MAG: DoxX family protein [Odoribacter sp.]|nr:DoxX family protein [Odoribacter sp.]
MKKFFFYLMAVLYIAAGLNHFRNPEFYMNIMPDYLPWHYELVIVSGVFEILFAIILLIRKTRVIGAWLIILLLIGVFPANIHMAVMYYQVGNPALWAAILRLPLQFLLIWWAYQYTKPSVLKDL